MLNYQTKTLWFFLLFCVSQTSIAFDMDTKGFITFAYSISDNKSPYLNKIDDDGDYSHGTKAGLQFSSILSPKVDVFMQLLVDGSEGRDHNFALDIAHVNYNFTDSHKVLYGKIRLPVFMISDYRQVAALYPWINPPEEVYNIVPLEDVGANDTFFGISFEGRIFQYGAHQTNYRIYTGGSERVSEKDRDDDAGGESEIKVKNLYGMLLEYEFKDIYLKWSYLKINSEGERYDFDADSYVEKEKNGTNFTSIGLKYDNDNIVMMSEFAEVKGETNEVDELESYYIMLGLYFNDNKFLFHTTFSDVLENSKTNQEIFQQTIQFGLNYDLDLSTVLKFNFKKVEVKNRPVIKSGDQEPREAGFFKNHPKKPVNIFSISINTMF